MNISVKELAVAVGKSTRTIQLKIKSGEIKAHKINAKEFEIELDSLPTEWQEKARAVAYTTNIQLHAQSQFGISNIIGRPLNVKEKQIFSVSNYFKNLDATISERQRVTNTAVFFGLSVSTVRRCIKKTETGGVIKQPQIAKNKAWCIEAEQFMKAYYLQLMKDRNINSKMSAYRAVQEEAEKQGWNIGSQASAYRILAEIPTLYINYATGGNRSLDNYFYIARDWSSLKPGQMLVGDQHICDFWVKEIVDGKEKYYRPTFYVWEDCATRCIAGLAVDKNYTSETVIQALYMAVCRFGFFDCTYNDNGTSECSKATTQIIDELIALSNGQSKMMDISELYKTKDGAYTIEDENGNIVDVVQDLQGWRSKRRRIYAAVKNAKTKPIERLFSTLEMKMSEKGIAGHVVTPNCPADQEEKESMVLEAQKRNGEILTLDEFVSEFVAVIDEYENTVHSSLGTAPIKALNKHIADGWKAKMPENMNDLEFVFMSRRLCKVTKGRIVINNINFIGEDLYNNERGDLVDVGLALHEGEKVEIRYKSDDPARAYAILPNTENQIRALKPVEAIEMLDYDAMQRMIEWKRHNMKVVREAFKKVAYPESIKTSSKIGKQLETATKQIEMNEEIQAEEKKKALLQIEEKKKVKKKILPFFRDERDRFKWCLDLIIGGEELSEKDKAFVQAYKMTEDYQEEEIYWETYQRLGGC